MSPLNITQPLGNMVYNGYYKVMSNIPKMGHLPIPGIELELHHLGLVQTTIMDMDP